MRGRPFDSEGGSNFVWTDNLFSAWARSENLFYVAWASSGKCNGKPQSRQLLESSTFVVRYKVELLR